MFNVSIEGRPAYATSDLLQQHPTKKHLFRVFGRADDQLILSTGEKTNPAPLGEHHCVWPLSRKPDLRSAEAILLQDPHVSACLMFGRGRFQNGVLIQPKESFDPIDEVKLEEYRNEIWCVLYCSALKPTTECSPHIQGVNREDECIRSSPLAYLQGDDHGHETLQAP